MTIRSLFDPSKDIYRTIEKVITYGASQEGRLKAEISEYVVTESIEEQFRKLLDRMQLAMESGGENEVGVWVSGFYGSGKSSFTKYLGLAFDDQRTIEGTPFIKYLQDRLHKPQTKALLSTVAQRFPAAVVMLDLASEMLAGATMEDVSTVLYFKVLKWAGYSDNLVVADLERHLERDGHMPAVEARIADQFPGKKWTDVHNSPLLVSALIPKIAHDFYPALFPATSSFIAETKGWYKSQEQQVQEMIDIVREKSGKQNIIFIVDEVGQYVASRDNLILNLDGLAKNLKRLGDGKAWIISTAQQTLTEDDPRAALNSDKLYKLKDRFPIQIDLESSDIKEICYRRLLGKSPAGETELGKLFEAHGQALRHNTKLQDAKYYDADFSKESFTNLYPFLPAHFDILLHLLGALAKSTGGIGLRSAIKVIQDVLKGEGGSKAMADQPVGWLATTVTLYDELEKDIRRAFTSIHQAVGKVQIRFPDSQLHQDIAKSVAVLQILGNLPVSLQNVTSLMHPSITASSQLDAVRKAVEEMLGDVHVPLGEKDGNLVFLSEKLRDIEQERGAIALRTVDVKRIFNDALRESFDPLPRVSLHGTMAVATGLKVQAGSAITSLAGDQSTIQTVVELVPASDYDTAKNRMLDDSRSRAGRNVIGLLARANSELDDLANEIYRCQRIAELHRNEPDQEVKDYCTGQLDRAAKLATQLQSKIKQTLQAGSFVFRGQATAVSALDGDLLEAAKKLLSDVADQVFDRYVEAPVRAGTDTAEKFLKVANPAAISSALDPLGLVQTVAGRASFKTDHKAMISIRDYIDKRGTVDGKRLLDDFSSDPFGWSPDTTRYIVAAMLMAGEIKLKVSGREVTAAGQQAIDALKTNNSFKQIGVALRDERPSIETLGRAAERLTELVGDMVIPLEQEISKAAAKHFPGFQHDYGDFRFVRVHWEVNRSANAKDWPYYLKGDSASPFYDDIKTVVNWKDDAKEVKQFITQALRGGHWSRHIFNSEVYFRRGLSWALRTSKFVPSCVPEGCIPSVSRYLAIPVKYSALALVELWNSSLVDALCKLRMERHGHPKFIVGVVKTLPTPTLNRDQEMTLRELAYRAWLLKRALESVNEDSHAFILPVTLRNRLGNHSPQAIEAELAMIQDSINAVTFDLYGFSPLDQEFVGIHRVPEDSVDIAADAENEEDDGAGEVDAPPIDALLSWAAGVALGRFDWRLATGERDAPPEPDPFDPLPAKSPGMLLDGAAPFHAHAGILVDDRGHPHDLARLIEEDLTRVNITVPDDVRRWLQRDFFPFHLQRYSKSRRKAPIYWPLSTTSGSYTLWVYYPSLNSQTLYTAINDFVEPKLKQVGADVTAPRNKGSARTRDDEKQFEALQDVELELIELRDTLLKLAPTYKPNHDDGVQISAAPVWALFRHKPWQKVLKDTWAKLEKGDYDWAHLAMNYWPERVREKCKTDKSLAIAHGLEDLYIEPEAKPKKSRGRR